MGPAPGLGLDPDIQGWPGCWPCSRHLLRWGHWPAGPGTWALPSEAPAQVLTRCDRQTWLRWLPWWMPVHMHLGDRVTGWREASSGPGRAPPPSLMPLQAWHPNRCFPGCLLMCSLALTQGQSCSLPDGCPATSPCGMFPFHLSWPETVSFLPDADADCPESLQAQDVFEGPGMHTALNLTV